MLEYKVVSYEYFMDVMAENEVQFMLPMLEYSNRTSWEQTRFSSYVTAIGQPRKKKITMKDICKFSWDKESDDVEDDKPTKEEIMRLRDKANRIANKMNGVQ